MAKNSFITEDYKLNKKFLFGGAVLLGIIMLLVLGLLSGCADDTDTVEPPQPSGEEIETPVPAETTAGNQAEEENNIPEQSSQTGENETNPDPTEAAAEKKTFTVEPNPQNFNQTGISFVFPGAIFGPPELILVEGSDETEMGGPFPGFKYIKFDSYFQKFSIFSPDMLVFPAFDYRKMNEYANESIELLLTMVADPQKITNAEELPFLPSFNAAQVFHSNVEVVEFKNGKGLRYLTAYYQDYSPVTNEYLWYTFQGLTTDGRYYVSITIPVYHFGLPANYEIFKTSYKEDAKELQNDYQGYVAKIASMLDQSAQNEFNPPLIVLDEMIKSLQIR